MLKMIIANKTPTKENAYPAAHVELPATDDTLKTAAKEIGVDALRYGSFKIIGTDFGKYTPLLRHIPIEPNMDKLNQMAQTLVKFDPLQQNTLLSLIEQADSMGLSELNRTVSEVWSDSLDTVKVYFPLDLKLRDHDNIEHYDDVDYWRDEVTPAEAVGYTGEILARLAKENSRFESPRGLMEYFKRDDSIDQKVYSMFPAVEEHDGELWGVMEMKVSETLTPDGINSLKNYVCAQNADGYGELLVQHEIKVDRGELYVSPWSSEKNYKICTLEEFPAFVPENNQTKGMGGIS